ncbi:calcium-binding protein [Octadecabacter sp. G9-8]|uniref:Calcium-binding protein n=1 Tax=Octadecabacter dasysiphoniae TaxID=2909341 RepID=A0ABS9CX28_9RHOB|nr:calcium-binding protein [Octadecabacter dasysiphoniae]
MELQFNGQFIVGDDAYDFGITDVSLITDTDGDLILVGVSQGSGGLFAWDMSDTSAPDFSTMRGGDTEFASAVGPSIVALDQGVLLTGMNAGGVLFGDANGNGGTTPLSAAAVQAEDWTSGVQLDNGLIALADAAGSGFSLFTKDSGTALSLQDTITDTNTTHATAITAMASFGNVLLVGSDSEYGISSYDTTATTTTAISSFGSDSGIGIMAPTAITTVQIGGQGYAIVASAGGSSGALSVFSIGTDGSLIPTDHAMDTLNTRFGAIQDVAVAPLGDGALVVSGGGDDGLTIMALMPNGRLVHLASFEDTATLALSGVNALDIVIEGTEATIFAVTQTDAGFSSMSIDLSDIGDWTIGTGGVLSGTNDDDILMTSSQAATLDGGGGHDIMVISEVGTADHKVRNFNPDEDRLNLSDWSFLYSADDLTFQTIWNGVTITHRDETLTVTGVANAPLSIDDVRATIDVDVMRLPTIPNDTIMGDTGDDMLMGNWAADMIYGEAGSDEIYGGAGDDTLDGGENFDAIFGGDGADILIGDAGNDTLTGGAGNDTINGGAGFDRAILDGTADFSVLGYDSTAETVTLQTADGIDTFQDVEAFIIGDTTHTFDSLAPPPLSIYGTSGDDTLVGGDAGVTLVGREGDDVIIGGAGGDTIKGGTGADSITGNGGNDDVLAGAGHDTIDGGAGDDILNAGADNDVVIGGTGTDTYVASLNVGRMFILDWSETSVTLQSSIGLDVISDVEFFQFDDSTVTLGDLAPDTSHPIIDGTNDLDRITVESGATEIRSFDGDDAVRSGSGSDIIVAGAGDDRVWGGTGRDQIWGGTGDDRLQGEAGNDMIYGGDGVDLLRGQSNNDLMYGGNDADVLYGGDGHDLMFGDAGDDFLSGGVRRDQMWGGAGDDDLRGGDDDDIIYGDDGADAIRGGEDDDIIFGGAGNDSILGGAGLDTIEGGSGDDTLSGGGDRDTFIFNADHGSDHITDYNMLRDSMILDAELVGSALNGQDVVDTFAAQTDNGVTFNFGDGSMIVLDGVATLDGLATSISIL